MLHPVHPDPDPAAKSDFVSSFTITYGPRELIAPYVLMLNRALADRGITLEHGTLEQLLETNNRNRDSWLPLFPSLNPESQTFTPENSFCFLGRDADGDIVATQAGRLFDWRGKTFKQATESLELLYADPKAQALAGETWTVSAPIAAELTGNIAFTGAVWYHPKVRGRGLATLLPPLARAYALAYWNVDATIVMMSQKNFSAELHKRTGHVNFQAAVHARGSTHGDVDYMLFWMRQQDIVREMGERLAGQADGVAVAGRNAQ